MMAKSAGAARTSRALRPTSAWMRTGPTRPSSTADGPALGGNASPPGWACGSPRSGSIGCACVPGTLVPMEAWLPCAEPSERLPKLPTGEARPGAPFGEAVPNARDRISAKSWARRFTTGTTRSDAVASGATSSEAMASRTRRSVSGRSATTSTAFDRSMAEIRRPRTPEKTSCRSRTTAAGVVFASG